MQQKKWLTYWKNSLSDSLKADIDIEQLKHFEIENFGIDSQIIAQIDKVNALIDLEEERINKKKGISNKESENWGKIEELQILISPFKVVPIPEHLVFLKDKKPKYPFWYYANINRQGKLNIPEEIFPVFQRRFLEPIADERTEFIISTVEKVDQATSIGKAEYQSFSDYLNHLNLVFNFAVGQDIKNYKTEGHETIFSAIILLPNEDINAAIGIIHLYEKILQENTTPQLLSKFITLTNNTENRPLDISKFIEANHLHIGQMGFDFPISISQRKSLLTFLKSDNQVFAVNGPPGTGKTTLLQSIVANKIVESAIAGDNPAIILACSTNNQAVTNIIDSFSKSNTRPNGLQGRWLPEIDGYATYLPANGKTEVELKGINYKKLNGDGLFSKVENYSYLEKANNFFLQKSSEYFNSIHISLGQAIDKLHSETCSIQTKLKDASTKWKEYQKSEVIFSNSYLNESKEEANYFHEDILDERAFEIDIVNLTRLEEKIILHFKNESFFRKLFCLLGFKSALRNRASEIRIIIRDSLISETTDFKFSRNAILELINTKIQIAKSILKSIREWENWKQQNAIKGNPPKTEDEYWKFENIKIEGLRSHDQKLSELNCFYDELDVTLRHKAFQLAIHYWEGRWLLKISNDLTDVNFESKGFDAIQNRWTRQAMLTPCFVSTFYMSPKFFSSFKFFKKGEDGKNIFDNPPLFNFVDLLIVDEAGQVSPEVGIATFSLAKKAVVVGDIKQIEPVWNITNKIDIGNLRKEGLIKNYEDLIYEKEFDPKGFLASTGSIMKMAQNACNYKEKGLIEKGVLLIEHRRCYDEIINYCNVLAYNGQQKPLKGKAGKENLYPPMYYILVEGNSTTTNSSRFNKNEANEIVNWLKNNKEKIETRYGKLEQAVGIITPFVGQKNILWHSLKNAGFDVAILKLGTVHALQGAERPIVIFSAVYGKGDSGTMFFDRDNKPNMLNVAVSRAKDSFIVFANTDIFDKNAKTPSGILSNHLLYETRNNTN